MSFETTKKLSKKDLQRVNWRYLLAGQIGWNYERMMSIAYTRALLPALEKLYPDKSERKEMLQTQLQFFNTGPHLATLIMGIDLAIEEDEGIKSKDTIIGLKTGLMGPFAAIGDSLFGAIIPTIMGSVAAYMGLEGSPIGAVLWLILSIAIVFLRYPLLFIGYKQGTKLVSSMSNTLKAITESATLLGITVVGALIPTVVNAKMPLEYKSGDVVLKMQDMLDQILPAMIPVLLVALAYWLLGLKKMNSTRVIWFMMILSIVLYNLHLLG
ncbi:PTS fructose transporter subunit IID [Enterococcus saigonensis]|uniref:PTS fructose transporter subunit IID n=1 Tax=Enterococcus saigonensis TaxID=1805431 RepID=A0A679I884_9ENTE|nr:PTS system mannose/fructose/sorbose family transporter subunit IID [Enterococcus saigonensis]BCA84563.1 PTS fructose transporter subunit IID [Enterococcus saigonensis]